MKSYIDPTLPVAGRDSVSTIARPEPIQIVYEFRQKGSPNAGATQGTVDLVLSVARQSGLFSEVLLTPASNRRRLIITINSVPAVSQDERNASAFGAGLRRDLGDTMVTDTFELAATLSTPGNDPLPFRYRHAMHTAVGDHPEWTGLTGFAPGAAVGIVVEQLVWSVLRDISRSGRL
ncbi:MAG: hypothetical protein ABIS68_12100 [Casimicrobiaceae bacterium]